MFSARVVRSGFGVLTLYEASSEIIEHVHREPSLVFRVAGADAEMAVAHSRVPLTRESFALVNPWVVHSRAALLSQSATVLALTLQPQWVCEVLQVPAAPVFRLFDHFRAELDGSMAARLHDVCHAVSVLRSESDSDARTQVDLGVFRLVSGIAERYSGSAVRAFMSRRLSPMDPRVAHAIERLDGAHGVDVDFNALAAGVGLSRSRFFELFKLCVGATPGQYCDCLLMTRATELMASSSMPASAIARLLGFSAAPSFTRFFLQHAGMPPSAYRRGHVRDSRAAAGVSQTRPP